MVEKTRSADKLSRTEAAEHIRAIADELEDGEQATIRTGNKTVDLFTGSLGVFISAIIVFYLLVVGDRFE